MVEPILRLWDFGQAGNGSQGEDDAALNAAIAHANEIGGNCRILYPSGAYKHGDIATPILAPRISIMGYSKECTYLDLTASHGTFLRWGDPALPTSSAGADSSFENFTVDWGVSSPTSIFGKISNYHRVELRSVKFCNFQILLSMGEDASKTASGIKVLGCNGFSANGGKPAFRLRFGTGFFLGGSSNFFVNVPVPEHPAPMATLPGTNLIDCSDGFWDWTQVDGGLYERWYMAFAITAMPGRTYQNFVIGNAGFDYCRYSTAYLEARIQGAVQGQILGFGMNGGWATCWEGHNFQIVGDGVSDLHSVTGVNAPLAGLSQLSYANPTANSNVFALNRVAGDNRTGGSAAAIHMVSGRGLHVSGNVGSTRSPAGILIAPGCTNYSVTNNAGSLG